MGISINYHTTREPNFHCRIQRLDDSEILVMVIGTLGQYDGITMFPTIGQLRQMHQALGDFLEAEDQKALKANRDKDQMELVLEQGQEQDQVIGQMDPAPIEQSQDLEMATVIKQAQEHGLVREEGI